MTGGLVALLILTFLVLIIIAKTAVVVPQQSAYVVERLGRFHGILNAGFHVLLPFWMSSVPLVERPVVFRRRCASRATTCRSASMACST